jgi:hypothetical protein
MLWADTSDKPSICYLLSLGFVPFPSSRDKLSQSIPLHYDMHFGDFQTNSNLREKQTQKIQPAFTY